MVVWIVIFFLSFSSQKASSRCGLLVNSWSQVVMGELFLSVYTTQCKKLCFWNTVCKDCKKKCPNLSQTKALLERPFAMCRAERKKKLGKTTVYQMEMRIQAILRSHVCKHISGDSMSSAELSTKEGGKSFGGTVCTSTISHTSAFLKQVWEEANSLWLIFELLSTHC